MKSQKNTKSLERNHPVTGLFSRKEAALKISAGARHLHSTLLGSNDACVSVTNKLLVGPSISYPWEICSPSEGTLLRKSSERQEIIAKILATTSFGKSSQNRERLKTIAEELLSNSFYHAYKNESGIDKYQRQKPVELEQNETIAVSFAESSNGIHLVIKDKGGSLTFENFASSLKRCYSAPHNGHVMEQKSSGAGLGLFLIFENMTHMSITVEPLENTTVSCWISNNTSFDPDIFSFNFFARNQK